MLPGNFWAMQITLSWSAFSGWLWNHAWVVLGLVGQALFTARFLVQWLASERKKDSVMPDAFWWLSLSGGSVTLAYAIHLQSLPFALGQGMGLFVYIRNLMLVSRRKRRTARRQNRALLAESDRADDIRPRPRHQPKHRHGHRGSAHAVEVMPETKP
jgi:lipid-A-disaccharide synthase-like uncharacterized protein